MMAPSDTACLVVLTTLPDTGQARALVREMVDRRLVACGTILGDVISIYRWGGVVEEANEVQVLFKTQRSRWTELESAIRELHPYDVPELVAVPVESGFEEYLTWIRAETGPTGGEAA